MCSHFQAAIFRTRSALLETLYFAMKIFNLFIGLALQAKSPDPFRIRRSNFRQEFCRNEASNCFAQITA